MKNNKILKILSISTALTLFLNITTFATKNNKNLTQNKKQIENIKFLNKKTKRNKKRNKKQNENINLPKKENDDIKEKNSIPSQENNITEIGGVKFKKLFTTPERISLYFNENNRMVTLTNEEDNETKCTIAFPVKVKNNEGKPHCVEHLLTSNNLGVIAPWKSLYDVNDKNADSGINAFTNIFDLDNDIALVVINLDKNTLHNKEKMEYLGKQLTGYADFLNDNMHTFNREILNKIFGKETSRILLEMYGKENPSENNEDALFFKETKEIRKKFGLDPGGVYKEMLKNNFDEIKDYYFENIVNNKPTIHLKVKNLEEASEPISLLEKFYFSKRKDKETKNMIEEKKENKDYFEIDVSPIYAKRTGLFNYFEIKDGISTPKKSDGNITIEYIIPNFTEKKVKTINCLKPKFIQKIFDEKNCPFLDISFFAESNKLKLTLLPKNEEIMNKKEVEKAVEDVSTKIIEYLEKNKIQKTDIEEQFLNAFKNKMKNNFYEDSYKFADNITKSYLADNKPFSEKYFIVDKNGQFENNTEKLDEYLINNCGEILKETLKENKKRIIVYKLNKEKFNEKENKFIEPNKRLFFPITYNKKFMEKVNDATMDVANEIIIESLLNKGLKETGLTYVSIDDSPIKGRFIHRCETDMEKQNIKDFFEKRMFKKMLQDLLKKIEGNSKDKYIEGKIKYFKDTILKNVENSLKTDKEKVENYIESLKKIKNIKNLTRDDITDQEKTEILLSRTVESIECAETLIKISEKELDSISKNRDNETKKMIEKQENLRNAINSRTKDDTLNNRIDEKTKKIYHEKLDLYIEILNNQIAEYDKYIEKIGEIKKQAEKLKIDDIKEALKNVEEKSFEEMNK